MPVRRLTSYSHCAGCAAKLAKSELSEVLGQMNRWSGTVPNLLVGTETGDDAAVWQLDAHRALVATVDFITPVVDDPRTWGKVAAANAVSDVYAMGGRPLLALNVVCWNPELGTKLLAEVLDGAAEVAEECGMVIAGGHTIEDPEPKFGLSVLGEVDPGHVLKNSALRAGDDLVLTKPVGAGAVSTALKAGEASEAVVARTIASMVRVNAEASRVALEAGATGATDVTGFGLLGHLGQMAESSCVDVSVDAASVPVLDGAAALVEAGHVSGGTRKNLRWTEGRVEVGSVDPVTVTLLADAQTSGGLLFGAEPARAEAAVSALRSSGHTCAVIGRVELPSGERAGMIRLG